MKRTLTVAALFFVSFTSVAQNVGIGTATPSEKLEVNNALRSTIKISSNNFIDTTELLLRNRNSFNLGTDFSLKSIREQGLFISSLSDLPENTSNNSLVILPNGRVGVKTSTPGYAFDVNGDMNTSGALRINGDAGANGQILKSNGDGTMSWDDLSEFKNRATFLSGGGTNWVVPSGVTRIAVEAWGGGGGGTAYCGGGGAGYICGFFTVTPGANVTFSIGTGGIGANENAGNGLPTTVTVPGGATLTAEGGFGPTFTPASLLVGSASGGDYSVSPSSYKNVFGIYGSPGSVGKSTFLQSGTSTFFECVSGANGGDAGNTSGTGAKGAYYLHNLATGLKVRSQALGIPAVPGGGGPGGYFPIAVSSTFGNGLSGANGMVIIHY